MSFKTLRNAGTISASTLGDDAAHDVDIGKLSSATSFRVTEFGGQDVFFLISEDYSAVTSTNGFYLKAGSTTTVNPSVRPRSAVASPVALSGTDSDSSDAGDQILLEEGTVGAAYDDGSYLLFDHDPTGYRISVINETGGSDGAVYVEEVSLGHAGV